MDLQLAGGVVRLLKPPPPPPWLRACHLLMFVDNSTIFLHLSIFVFRLTKDEINLALGHFCGHRGGRGMFEPLRHNAYLFTSCLPESLIVAYI